MQKARLAFAVLLLFSAILWLNRGKETTETFLSYTKPGTYGPKSGTTTICGDITVTSPQVRLQNMEITGNLYLSCNAEGTVQLDNVSAKGVLLVGSSKAVSVSLSRCLLTTLILNNTDDPATVIFEDSHSVPDVEVRTSAPVELSGSFQTITLTARRASLSLRDGRIASLTVAEHAADSYLQFHPGATVAYLELNAPATVTGGGTIEEAAVNATDCTLLLLPGKITRSSQDEPDTAAMSATDQPRKAVILYPLQPFTLTVGETRDQSVTTVPAGAFLDVRVSNPDVAKAVVSGNNIIVTALAAGTARVSVLASHPEYNGGSAGFTVTVTLPKTAPPAASPRPGTHAPGTEITLSSGTTGAVIFYTTDGSKPSTGSTRYDPNNKPRVPEGGFTLRAMGVREGMAPSDTPSYIYVTPAREDAPPPEPAETTEPEPQD